MHSGRFTFSEHVAELRKRLRIVAFSFLIILIVLIVFPANPASSFQNPGQYLSLAFIQNTVIASFLGQIVHDLLPYPWLLTASTGLGEPMEIYFVAAIVLSLALDTPVIAYETFRFIDPALNARERGLVYPFVAAASVLFVVGLLFGYLLIAKFLILALGPFFAATGVSYLVDAGSFYYVILLIIGATGVSFTSPVFVYTLIRLRIVGADFFSKNRLVIWFVTWVVTGLFLTPDGGPLLDLVIFVPIVFMLEVAVALGRRSVKDLAPPQGPRRRIVCPHCGKELDHPMLFCDSCGKSIA